MQLLINLKSRPWGGLLLVFLILTFLLLTPGSLGSYICKDDEFDCGDGRCIPSHWRCDGVQDCNYRTDEINCTSIKGQCDPGEYRCNKLSTLLGGVISTCIQSKWFCDADYDCVSREDEDPKRCAWIKGPRCEGKFRCNQVVSLNGSASAWAGQCIDLGQICDGHRDCDDGSDEADGFCANCPVNHGCEQLCVKSRNGTQHCKCRPGFNLASDNTTCLDIDECQSNPPVCSHSCTNTEGGYNCSCSQGYALDSSKKRCSAIGSYDAHLIFAIGADLKAIDLKTKIVQTIALQGHGIENLVDSPQSLAVNARNQIIYWATKSGRLYKTHLTTGANFELIKGLEAPNMMSYDWIGQNLYVVTQFTQMNICNIERGLCTTIFRKSDAHFTSVAIAASNYIMFWSAVSNARPEGNIWRSNMDGSGPRAIVSGTKVKNPESLTIDFPFYRLYWVDRSSKGIFSCNFDGSDFQRELFSDSLTFSAWKSHPLRQMDIFEDNVYIIAANGYRIVNRITQAVDTLSENSMSEMVMMIDPSKRLVYAVHDALQPTADNPCSNQTCEHICVPLAQSYKCLCSNGYDSNDNGHHCRLIPPPNDTVSTSTSSPRIFTLPPGRAPAAYSPSKFSPSVVPFVSGETPASSSSAAGTSEQVSSSSDTSPAVVAILIILSIALIANIAFIVIKLGILGPSRQSFGPRTSVASGGGSLMDSVSYAQMTDVPLNPNSG